MIRNRLVSFTSIRRRAIPALATFLLACLPAQAPWAAAPGEPEKAPAHALLVGEALVFDAVVADAVPPARPVRRQVQQQHVEVTLNGDYIGVYLLSEDIRIDPARLNIRRMSASVAAATLPASGIQQKCPITILPRGRRRRAASAAASLRLDQLRTTGSPLAS